MRAGRLSILFILVAAAVAGAADHPLFGDYLRLKDPADPARRRVKFRAARDFAIDPAQAPDPRLVGGTLEILGTGSGDGAAGPLTLDPGKWTGVGSPPGSLGYRYVDVPTAPVRRIDFRSGAAGGRIVISARGSAWPYAVTQPQEQIEVRLTIGSEVYCAEFSGFEFIRNENGLVVGRDGVTPPDCAVPVCGNGAIESPEECDDGGTMPGDGCDAVCDIEPICGNGEVEGTEECDDGNLADSDGCSSTCTLENASALCAGVATTSGTDIDGVLIANGLTNPLHLTSPRLDTNRLFVSEQFGRIVIIKNGVLLPTPFLDIQSKVQCAPECGERGILSVAFHPEYESNGRFFVAYTRPGIEVVIARYQVSVDPDIADDASEQILLVNPKPFNNHNAGQLAFGPDGYLYVSTGDGGGVGDPQENGQDDTSLLGKMLRLDVDVEVPPYYAVPATNPNAGAGDPLGLIWAKGFRNPWRFAFDRANGDLYIGDVGQEAREEIDYQPASSTGGENYGWNAFEGTRCFNPPPHFGSCAAALPSLTAPIHDYGHGGAGSPCSVTGGFVYRGCRMPDLRGTYFYADFCTDKIKTFTVSGGNAVNHQDKTTDLDPLGPLAINAISSFGEDARGEIYIVDRNGEIFRIDPE